MNERKSYAVFWRHRYYGEWLRSCEWADTPDAARQELNRIKKNSRCAGAKVVERTEMFKTVEEWENEENNYGCCGVDDSRGINRNGGC